jgi:polyhydroxyalkanoate synthesis repressor PhaR
MLNKPDAPSEKRETVVIKKYANRRLYNTETSSYVTLEDLGTMVRGDRDFVVYDAKTGDDLTHGVLTQIIVEQESKSTGPSMLPIPFLRQLIRFYDDSMAKVVPGYLQFSLESLAKEQTKFRSQYSGAFGSPTAAFDVYQDQVRKNMDLFEQALTMWVASPSGQAAAANCDARKSEGDRSRCHKCARFPQVQLRRISENHCATRSVNSRRNWPRCNSASNALLKPKSKAAMSGGGAVIRPPGDVGEFNASAGPARLPVALASRSSSPAGR